MQTDSFQIIRLSVQEHSLLRIEADRAESVCDDLLIPEFPVFHQTELERIEFRCFRRPQPEIFQFERGLLSGKGGLENDGPGRIGDRQFDPALLSGVIDLDSDRRPRLLRLHRPVPDPDSGPVEMFLFENKEPRLAIDSRAGIPAGRLFRIRHPDRKQILLLPLHQRRDLQGERGVSIRPSARFLPVDEDRGPAHDSVEFKEDAFSPVLRAQGETESIPPDADMRQSACTAVVGGFGCFAVLHDPGGIEVVPGIEGSADGPVVRDLHALPGGVVQRRRGGIGIGPAEAPALLQYLNVFHTSLISNQNFQIIPCGLRSISADARLHKAEWSRLWRHSGNPSVRASGSPPRYPHSSSSTP